MDSESVVSRTEIVNMVDDPKLDSVSHETLNPTAAGETAAAKTSDEKPDAEKDPEKKGRESGEPEKVPAGVQKRIDQAIARQRATERENAKLKTELAQLKQKAAEAPAPKPDSSKFESQEEYLEALAGWKAEEAMKAKEAKQAKAESEAGADEEKAAAESLMESGKEKFEDFEAVVMDENLKISPEMLDAALQSDIGHDVLYWFGKHPKEAQRIAALRNPVTVAREVGKIEARISAEPESVKPKPKVSQAPDPINPVKSGTVSDNALESMNMREYIAKRKQQDASILIG